MKKIWLFLGGGVLVVFIAAIVLFFVVNNQFKPEKTVDSFNQAVKDEDLETLEKLIEPDDENLEIDKHSLKAFIAYLQTNNKSYQSIKDGFKKQIEDEDFSTTDEQITLFEDGKKMGIFPDYKLRVKGVNVKVKGDNDEEQLNLGLADADYPLELAEEEDDLYGPLLPGEYTVEATVQNNLGTFKNEEKLDLWDDSSVSFLIDNEELASESEDVQKDIINATNQFNEDMAVYVTSEFDVDEFTNVTDDFKSSLIGLDTSFELNKEYIKEMESQFEKTIVDLDSIDLSQFDDEWEADATMLVSYKERIQLEDEDDFEDISYTELREFSMTYDPEEEIWVIEDYYAEDADESDSDSWDNKEEMKMEDSKLHKWSDDENEAESYI